ncbi:hypothetical protein HDU98_000489 [Podochytrium sp. JEL0797]|nr:hypothetical protein HDU98_000489 [Podochytrium sp. JEL0797]
MKRGIDSDEDDSAGGVRMMLADGVVLGEDGHKRTKLFSPQLDDTDALSQQPSSLAAAAAVETPPVSAAGEDFAQTQQHPMMALMDDSDDLDEEGTPAMLVAPSLPLPIAEPAAVYVPATVYVPEDELLPLPVAPLAPEPVHMQQLQQPQLHQPQQALPQPPLPSYHQPPPALHPPPVEQQQQPQIQHQPAPMYHQPQPQPVQPVYQQPQPTFQPLAPTLPSSAAPDPPAATYQPPPPQQPQEQQQPQQPYIQTALDRHQLKFCSRTLSKCKRLKDAYMFSVPVDPIKLNIPQYFTFIKHPMDLSTIQRKLETHVYKTAAGFMADVQLMFDNCFAFNGREGVVAEIAKRFQGVFEKEYLKMPQVIETEKRSRPSGSFTSAHGGYGPTTPTIDRPKRDVHPPSRDHMSPISGSTSTSRKPVSKQAASDLKFASTLVRDLMKQKYYSFAYPFLEPVDWVKYNIPTYPLIIKHPMDFGTILKRLDQGYYGSGYEFEGDAKLVFRNCYTFNAAGSDVHEMGRKLEQVFDLRWREKPVVREGGAAGGGGRRASSYGGESDSSSSGSEEEQEDLNKMQENLLKLMQEVTKLAQHKGSKKKEKKNKHKIQALLQQQALAAAVAGASSSVASSSMAPPPASRKKKRSSSSSHRRAAAPAATANVREITYQQKKELSEKIEILSPDKLEGVYQIIRSGMPSLDTQAAGQDEIELDIDSLDKVTLSQLYHFVINAAAAARAPAAQPKSLSSSHHHHSTMAPPPPPPANGGGAASSDDSSSGSDSDSGSD